MAKNKNTAAPKTETATPVTPATVNAKSAELVAALDALFAGGEYEIPDECVEGKLTGRIAALEAQVKTLLTRVLELQRSLEGKPASGRIDVVGSAPKTPAPVAKK